jgi:hypothetical protein
MFGHQDEPKNEQENDANDNNASDNSSGTMPVSPAITPQFNPHNDDAAGSAPSVALPNPGDDASDTDTPSPGIGANPLIDIKQQALQQLTPLVGHLEQSPEEKFRTTMMMIQASDNQDLIKTAYEAAQAITDEKTRAQALLDIVNEINYFTQHQPK